MATRLKLRHQEDVKAKIQVSQIINRLQDNLNGKIELTTGQIQSARILLDKTMSNAPQEIAQKTEHSGEIKQRVEVHIIDHQG